MCVGIEIDESMDRGDEEDSFVLLYRIASSCYLGWIPFTCVLFCLLIHHAIG